MHHSAGPTWRHVDGSEVKGKVIAKQDAPKPDAIPWLLLGATGHSGEGVFGRVTSIQRIHTEGGLPPIANTCDASANGKESRNAYSADYYFTSLSTEESPLTLRVPLGKGAWVTGQRAGSLGAMTPQQYCWNGLRRHRSQRRGVKKHA